MPLGLVVRGRPDVFEAVANGDDGAPLGRELEIADLLRVHPRPADPQRRVRHRQTCTTAPRTTTIRRAPLHRLPSVLGVRRRAAARRHVRPGALDRTFGPEVKFIGIPPGMNRIVRRATDFSFSARCGSSEDARP